MTEHRPPLAGEHEALGATFAPFGGWLMPLEYPAGVIAEHETVRRAVGLFDVSHLGKLRVAGPGAVAYLNTRLANDLTRIASGQAQYTVLCNATGGVVDDLIAYIFDEDDVLLIPNAANATAVAKRLSQSSPPALTISDGHQDYVVLAVQGPRSAQVVEAIGLPADMEYMAFRRAEFGGFDLTVCRTGYTGEHGYELVAPNAAAVPLWRALLEAGQAFGALPCGLGARDTLRTEMGYPLHGQDISAAINPVAAGLSWVIGWTKPTFDGADALRAVKAAGPARRLRGLRAQGRGIPRPGQSVVTADGCPLGNVTSGTFSPTLRTGIALALLDAGVSVGDVVSVDVRGRLTSCDVVKLPIVDSGVR